MERSKPRPSSSISTCRPWRPELSETETCFGAACLRAFCSASRTIISKLLSVSAPRSSGAPELSNLIGIPVSRLSLRASCEIADARPSLAFCLRFHTANLASSTVARTSLRARSSNSSPMLGETSRATSSAQYRSRKQAGASGTYQGEDEDRIELVSAAYRLRKSACYAQSRGSLSCVSCHNPHEPSSTPAALRRYTEACQGCHQTAVRKLVEARRHPASQECVSCHMPKRRPSDAIHTSVTDHFIQARPTADPTGTLVEKHDGNTPPYRGRVSLYYPARLEKTAENELYLALAQVKHDANLDRGLRELEAAIARHAPARSEFYFELADAYRRAGNLQKAIAFYEQSCARQPADWRHFYGLGTALTAAGQAERAAAALERALALAPKEPAALEAIANLLSRQRKSREAVATLQAALDLDPESASVQSNLGARLFLLNDVKGAERAWREAVRLRPEAATMRLNLANLLASDGRFQEARYHFSAAIRIAPTFADAHLAYAIALAAHGDATQSERHLREAIKYAPNHFEAHLRLGQALRDRGDAAGAAPHLRKAAESPDARIRDAANKLLN